MVSILYLVETEEDRNIIEQLYQEYEGIMYSVAFKYLGEHHCAEDAVWS